MTTYRIVTASGLELRERPHVGVIAELINDARALQKSEPRLASSLRTAAAHLEEKDRS